jgi:hypothetical protein
MTVSLNSSLLGDFTGPFIIFGQISGFLLLNESIVLLLIAVLIILDIVMIYFTVRLFQRETILTRWK